MSYEKREQPKDQQAGGMTIQEFADLNDLPVARIRKLIGEKRIIGVSRNPLSHRITIFPPAKIVDKN